MRIVKRVILHVVTVCFVGILGCSDESSQDSAVQVIKENGTSLKLECIQTELTNVAAYVHSCCIPSYDYVASLTNQLSALSPFECEEAFRFMEKTFSRPQLKEFPLSDRELSMFAYGSIVLNIANIFSEKLENPAEVWDFLLRAIALFDSERIVVSAPDFDPHPPALGLRITKGMYAQAMEHEKHKAIRFGFEKNSFFVNYYHQLPDAQQKTWIARLEKVAGRKVTIFDPKNPYQESPRQQFTVPADLPLELQEKIRNRRRDALKAAGIDPAVEGL